MDHEESVVDFTESDEGIGDEEEDVEEEGRHDKLLETITALDGRKRPVVQRSEPSAVISEFNLSQGLVGKEKVRLHELVTSLKETSGHIALKKQLRAATRRTRVLNVPLSKPQAERIKREVSYGKVTKELEKWDPIVDNNRVADHLEFPLKQPFLGNISTESFVKKFQHQTPLELEVAKILSGSDNTLTDDKTLTPAEERALKAMSLEEAKERLAELRKARALLSYKESRARRQNKIKSKGYHRILKRERIRRELKEFEELQKTDPEKAIDRLKEIDKLRIEERMTLKHKNTGKWAKQRMIRAKYDEQSRAALTEQLELSRQLTKKVRAPSDSEDEEADPSPTVEEVDKETNDSEFIPLQAPLASYNPWMRSSSSKRNEETVVRRTDFGKASVTRADDLPDDSCTLSYNVGLEVFQNNLNSREEHGALVTSIDDSETLERRIVDNAHSEETNAHAVLGNDVEKEVSLNHSKAETHTLPDSDVGKEVSLSQSCSEVAKEISLIQTSSSEDEDDDVMDLSSDSESEVTVAIQSRGEGSGEISMVKDSTLQNSHLVTLRSDSENSDCEVVGSTSNMLTVRSDSESLECEIVDRIRHREADHAIAESQNENAIINGEDESGEFSESSTGKVSSSVNSAKRVLTRNRGRKFLPTESFDGYSDEVVHQSKAIKSRKEKKILKSRNSTLDVSVPDKLSKDLKALHRDSTLLEKVEHKEILSPGEFDQSSSFAVSPSLANVAKILDEFGEMDVSSSELQKMMVKHRSKISKRSKSLPSFVISPLNDSLKVSPLRRLNGCSDDESNEPENSLLKKCRVKVIRSKKAKPLPTFLISPLNVSRKLEKLKTPQRLNWSYEMGEDSLSEPKENRFARCNSKILRSRKSRILPSFSVSQLSVAEKAETQKLNNSYVEEMVKISSEEDGAFTKLQNKSSCSRMTKTRHCSTSSSTSDDEQVPTLTPCHVDGRSRGPVEESFSKCRKKVAIFTKSNAFPSHSASSNSGYHRATDEHSKGKADEVAELPSEPEEESFLDETVLGENELENKTEGVVRLNRKDEDQADASVLQPQKKPEVQIDPTKFVIVNSKRLKGKLPDLVDAGDEGVDDDDDDETSYKMTIAEAFADDDVLDEFRAEKRRIVDEDRPKDVDLFLPGWGSWGGQGIKSSRRKRRRFVLKAPDAPPRKDGALGNVIINEKKDLKAAEYQVSELPFPFKTVRDYESSIRLPLGNTWNPETAFRQLIVPKVTTRMGAIIDPIDGDALKAKPKRPRRQKNRKTGKNSIPNKTVIEV